MAVENGNSSEARRWNRRLCFRVGAALVAMAVLTVGVLWFSGRQQRYLGRPLRYWVDRLDAADPSATPSICAEAKIAVRAIGTNALPALLAWLQHKDSGPERRLNDWLYSRRIFRPITSRFGVAEVHYHFRAGLGFQALGELARPALSTLEHLMLQSDEMQSRNAAGAIVLVDPEHAERLVGLWCSSTNAEEVAARERMKTALAFVKPARATSTNVGGATPASANP